MVNLRTGHRPQRYVFTGIFRPKSGFVTGNGCLARKPHDGIMSLRDKHAFRLLLGGSTASMLGSRVSTIAYPMLVLYLTGSPVYAGFAVFAAIAPSILVYIPAGALVDRWDPWRTMLASEIGRGLAIGGVVGALALHCRSVPLIITLAVIEEILETFGTLAERRYVYVLAGPEQTSSALIRTEARSHAVVLAGRPLGGLLFEWRPIWPFLADLASFAISITALAGVPREQRSRSARVPISKLVEEAREGLSLLRADKFGCRAILLASGMTLISQALIMVFLAEAHTRHLSSTIIGIVLAASGLGGFLGSAISTRITILSGHSRIKIQPFIWCIALFALVISRQSWQIPCTIPVMLILGFTGAMSNIEFDTYMVEKFPDAMLARVMSIDRLAKFAAYAVGPALGGIVVAGGASIFQAHDVQIAVGCLVGMTSLLVLVSFRTPSLATSIRTPLASPERAEPKAVIVASSPEPGVPDAGVSVVRFPDPAFSYLVDGVPRAP
jgi:predicted MFS family arabinose efflux permease